MKTKTFLAAAALCLVLSACGDGEKLYVYNWGDYISENALSAFEKSTGVKVVYETYDSNETMYAKLKPGNAPYDIAIPSDYMLEKMLGEGMLEKIDFSNVPNYKYIDDKFKNRPFDPAGEYSVPYMWGTLGILYNTERTGGEAVTSWDVLWDFRYKGEIFMYDSMRDSFAIALKRLNLSLNTTDMNELSLAKAELIKQKPLVRAYLGDPVKDSMIGGEGALAVMYSGDAFYCMGENDALSYCLPAEGSNIWFDCVVIPKGAKNKANAEKFINFLCDPDIALENTMYIGFSTTNAAAYNKLPSEIKNSPVYWPPDDALDKCEVFNDLGAFVTEYDKAWTEVLSAAK